MITREGDSCGHWAHVGVAEAGGDEAVAARARRRRQPVDLRRRRARAGASCARRPQQALLCTQGNGVSPPSARALTGIVSLISGTPVFASHMQKVLSKPPLKKRPVSTGYLGWGGQRRPVMEARRHEASDVHPLLFALQTGETMRLVWTRGAAPGHGGDAPRVAFPTLSKQNGTMDLPGGRPESPLAPKSLLRQLTAPRTAGKRPRGRSPIGGGASAGTTGRSPFRVCFCCSCRRRLGLVRR